jgi:hypothetical protein
MYTVFLAFLTASALLGTYASPPQTPDATACNHPEGTCIQLPFARYEFTSKSGDNCRIEVFEDGRVWRWGTNTHPLALPSKGSLLGVRGDYGKLRSMILERVSRMPLSGDWDADKPWQIVQLGFGDIGRIDIRIPNAPEDRLWADVVAYFRQYECP